jgi:hypothetical protein
MTVIDSSGNAGSNNGVTAAGQSYLNGTSNIKQSSTVSVVTGARSGGDAGSQSVAKPAQSNFFADLLGGVLGFLSGGLGGLFGGLFGGKGGTPFDFLKTAVSFIPGGSVLSKLFGK